MRWRALKSFGLKASLPSLPGGLLHLGPPAVSSSPPAAGMIGTFDAAAAGAPTLHFHLSDWLGSRRVQTDANGTIEETYSSLPFGDGLVATVPTGAPSTADDATEHHFTGKERDSESG